MTACTYCMRRQTLKNATGLFGTGKVEGEEETVKSGYLPKLPASEDLVRRSPGTDCLPVRGSSARRARQKL